MPTSSNQAKKRLSNKVQFNGITFDSEAECRVYQQMIRGVKFPLIIETQVKIQTIPPNAHTPRGRWAVVDFAIKNCVSQEIIAYIEYKGAWCKAHALDHYDTHLAVLAHFRPDVYERYFVIAHHDLKLKKQRTLKQILESIS